MPIPQAQLSKLCQQRDFEWGCWTDPATGDKQSVAIHMSYGCNGLPRPSGTAAVNDKTLETGTVYSDGDGNILPDVLPEDVKPGLCDLTETTCPVFCDYIIEGVSRTELIDDGGGVLSAIVDGQLVTAPGAVVITIGGVSTVVSSTLDWDATADPTGAQFAADIQAWFDGAIDAESVTVTATPTGQYIALAWTIIGSENVVESVTYDGVAGGGTFTRAFDQENCTEELQSRRVQVCGKVALDKSTTGVQRGIVDWTGTDAAPVSRQIPGGFLHGSMAVLSGTAEIDGVLWGARETLDLPPMSFGSCDRLYPEHTIIATGRTRFIYYYE